MHKNKFDKGDLLFVLKVRLITIIDSIDMLFVLLKFVFSHNIWNFIQGSDFKELGMIKMMITIRMYGRFAKSNFFLLMMVLKVCVRFLNFWMNWIE
jgi:mannose/fructose/N-acetylgalactosamine-specific phosphotransferase system component IIC